MNILSGSVCCKDKTVASWIITICYIWFQEGFCGEKSTPGGCTVAGIWGVSPLCIFPVLLAGLCSVDLSRPISSFTSKYQLKTDLSILSTPCHLFPWFHPGSLLGLLTVGSSPRFVFLQQVHEMAAVQAHKESDRCLLPVISVYIAFTKAPFPGTGFSLLGPEDSMLFLTHIGGWHKP